LQEIRRGHLKFYILRLLIEQRRTGYGLMKAIETETGFWKPSTGSLYPLLSTMREAGLICEAEEPNGTSRWEVTPEGRETYAQAEETKRELLDNMRRSLVVFAKVFDAKPLESLAELLTSWQDARSDSQVLGPLIVELQDALWDLPQLTSEQEERVQAILRNATSALEAFRSSSEEDPPR